MARKDNQGPETSQTLAVIQETAAMKTDCEAVGLVHCSFSPSRVGLGGEYLDRRCRGPYK